MKRFLLGCLLWFFLVSFVFAGTTEHYGWDYGVAGLKPWYTLWQTIFTRIDDSLYTVQQASLNPSEYDNGTIPATVQIDPSKGSKQKLTLGGNIVVSFLQPSSGTRTLLIKIVQATGPHYNPTWTGVTWLGSGVAPTIYQTDGAIDFVSCYLDGTATFCMGAH